MVKGRSSRKLAVILHADIVGSTALVRRNEATAHDRIQDAFRRFSEKINAFDGITHELRGDALLAEFNRASDAVSASLSFQAENAEFNKTLDDDIRPEVRIGISLGEVIIADDTLTGPDVVLAQRIEQLAQPGGVCVSATVKHAVPRRLPFEFQDLGEQEVKGFEETVRIFSVGLCAGEQLPAPESPNDSLNARTEHSNRRWIAGGVVMLLAIAGGLAVGLQSWSPELPPTTIAEEPQAQPLTSVKSEEEARVSDTGELPLPTKPSIAVLPFTNMSDDPKQEYFSDGITEDLITDLSKLSNLLVIARNSTFTYKGKAVKVRQIAKELGVRYVLEGSVRRAGDQIRINAQLIDATTGGHLWAERYDGTLANVFALQDQVTEQIVTALSVKLTPVERVGRTKVETNNPKAYDAFLKGWAHYQRQTQKDFAEARDHFEMAIELDPDYNRAFAALAALYWDTHKRVWGTALIMDGNRVKANAYKYRDLAMINPTPLALVVASDMLIWVGQHEKAIVDVRRAIELAPNDAYAQLKLAEILVYAGRPRDALEFIENAAHLDPLGEPRQQYIRGLARFGLDQFDAARASLERALELNPGFVRPAVILASTYGYLGREQDAANSIKQYKNEYTWAGTAVSLVVFRHPYKHEKDRLRLADGLRRIGMKEYE